MYKTFYERTKMNYVQRKGGAAASRGKLPVSADSIRNIMSFLSPQEQLTLDDREKVLTPEERESLHP